MRAFVENELMIKRFLRRYASNSHDIEDISQETITRALRAEQQKEILEPKAFLFGVAKNIARKSLDKKSKSLIDFIEDFGDREYLSDEPSVEAELDGRKKLLVFWEAVSKLPPQCQKVFVLKKVHGYSHKQIAKYLDISISTVEKHAAAGLLKCAEYVDAQQSNTGGEVVELDIIKENRNSALSAKK
jgi:RNA polymerase sigma factor (sigma-70 family)